MIWKINVTLLLHSSLQTKLRINCQSRFDSRRSTPAAKETIAKHTTAAKIHSCIENGKLSQHLQRPASPTTISRPGNRNVLVGLSPNWRQKINHQPPDAHFCQKPLFVLRKPEDNQGVSVTSLFLIFCIKVMIHSSGVLGSPNLLFRPNLNNQLYHHARALPRACPRITKSMQSNSDQRTETAQKYNWSFDDKNTDPLKSAKSGTGFCV